LNYQNNKPEAIMKILEHSGVRCRNCKDIIYSRTAFDIRQCSCGACSVTGGFDFFHTTYPAKMGESLELKLATTRKILYNDWASQSDKYGLIKIEREYDE
jgi:ribosomal protein L37AE/L43A